MYKGGIQMKYFAVFLFSVLASFVFVYQYFRKKYIRKYRKFQEHIQKFLETLQKSKDDIDKIPDLRKGLIILGLTILEIEEQEDIDTDFIRDYDEFIKQFTEVKRIALSHNENIVDREQLMREFFSEQS